MRKRPQVVPLEDKRKNFFKERVVKHWNRLSVEEVEFPTLDIIKRHASERDTVY